MSLNVFAMFRSMNGGAGWHFTSFLGAVGHRKTHYTSVNVRDPGGTVGLQGVEMQKEDEGTQGQQ